MGRELVVTAIGEDRPGIVAGVTEVLLEHGCNLQDTSMTILRGRFAMMLVVDGPDDVGPLADALGEVGGRLGVEVAVAGAPAGSATAGGTGGEPYVVSLYGADAPGLLARIARHLAGHGVNITDLSTRLIGEREQPVYAMVLDVVVPAGLDPDELSASLGAAAATVGLHCRLHPGSADVL